MSRLYRARQQVVRRVEGGRPEACDQPPVSTVPTSTFSPDEV